MVENGDRIRVANLENTTGVLVREVATLGGELHTHMDQAATDKIEAKRENEQRHRDVMGKIDDTLGAVRNNAAELKTINRLDEDRGKRTAGETSTFPMRLNGAKVPMAAGAFGGGSLVLALYELYKWGVS